MADDRGDQSVDAGAGTGTGRGADEVAERLAELHRRSEALAERMADFRSETEQLMREAGGGNGAASSGDGQPTEQSDGQPTGQSDGQPAEEATGAAAPGAVSRPHRPRPSAAAPLKYRDSDADEPGAEQTAAESTPGAAPVAAPEAAPEARAKPAEHPRTEPTEKAPRRGLPGWVTRVRNLVITVVVVVAVAFALRTWVVAPFYVPSASMEPTLHGCPGCNDDHVLVQKIAYYFHDPRRGDIVVFDKPAHWHVNDSELIKRVIGTPGDKLVLRDGRVYINGQKLNESYVKKCRQGTQPENGRSSWTVPKNRLFVMGDNRCDSEDSRRFGMVPIDNVVGEAFLIYWPVGRFGSP